MVKVVFYRHSLLSRGGDKMVLAHANHLAETGHQIRILTNHVDTVFPIHPSIKIEAIPLKGKLGTLTYALCRQRWADIVIADIIMLAVLLRLSNCSKTIYFAQDFDESYYRSRAMQWLVRIFYLVGLRYLKIKTFAVSTWLAELLSHKFLTSVSVAPNGVDLSVFYPEPDPGLVRQKGNVQAILVLCRSDQRKGFDIARDVIEGLRCKGKKIIIWTVGELHNNWDGDEDVQQFGYVREDRLRQIMSSADLFLYPTRHEGFGLMVLEAFACGCPVVTTEAVVFAANGENALVARPEDTPTLQAGVETLLTNGEACLSLQQKGFETARAFSLESGLDRFAILLKSSVRGEQ